MLVVFTAERKGDICGVSVQCMWCICPLIGYVIMLVMFSAENKHAENKKAMYVVLLIVAQIVCLILMNHDNGFMFWTAVRIVFLTVLHNALAD